MGGTSTASSGDSQSLDVAFGMEWATRWFLDILLLLGVGVEVPRSLRSFLISDQSLRITYTQ
jgi:hypothetical protein